MGSVGAGAANSVGAGAATPPAPAVLSVVGPVNLAATAAAGNIGGLGRSQAHVVERVDCILVVHVGTSRHRAPGTNFKHFTICSLSPLREPDNQCYISREILLRVQRGDHEYRSQHSLLRRESM